MTPFFEALVQFARFPRQAGIEDSGIQQWFEAMQGDSNFIPTLDRFGDITGVPMDQLTHPELLRLGQIDTDFRHDCIGHGTRMSGTTPESLQQKWDAWRSLLITQRIGDPLFRKFDALFRDSQDWDTLRDRFEDMYFNGFHRKLIHLLRSRSQHLIELVRRAGTRALQRWRQAGGERKRIQFDDSQVRNQPYVLKICVDDGCENMLCELIHNAIKFASTSVQVIITPSRIVIENDGRPFQEARWKESPKSKIYPELCRRHLLDTFTITSGVSEGAKVIIGEYNRHRAAENMPVNASGIQEARRD